MVARGSACFPDVGCVPTGTYEDMRKPLLYNGSPPVYAVYFEGLRRAAHRSGARLSSLLQASVAGTRSEKPGSRFVTAAVHHALFRCTCIRQFHAVREGNG